MVMNKIQDLIAAVEFWYARKFIKLDKHYTFFLDLNGPPGSFAIKFFKKYDGVIVEFANVKVGNDGQLTFDYDIISNVNNCNVKTRSFERFTQNVMRSILYGAIQNDVREKNENRNTDLVEFDSEREVHEEISAVPQERVSNRKPRKKGIRRNKTVHSEIQQSASDSSTGDQPQRVDQTH
jgi:hypothetical protein